LATYGAFVDIGGVDGLLHISDMAWSRVKAPEDVLSVGHEIQVKILSVDAETKKISLGLKQLQPEPWDGAAADVHGGAADYGDGDAADGLWGVCGVGAGD
jgi:small subunit ribosomal protein S1